MTLPSRHRYRVPSTLDRDYSGRHYDIDYGSIAGYYAILQDVLI